MSFFGSKKPETPSPSSTPSPAPSQPVRRAPAPAPSPSRPATAKANRTHVASGSKVVGRVTGDAELVIDGHLDGEVELKSHVVVGEKGRVDGTVRAVSVQLAGKVKGNIEGEERVEVLPSGSLEGDVTAPRVMIADGAFFKGKVEMTAPAPIKSAKPEPKPEPKPEAEVAKADATVEAKSETSDVPKAAASEGNEGGAGLKPSSGEAKGPVGSGQPGVKEGGGKHFSGGPNQRRRGGGRR